jgi:hypothetical protein
VIGPKSRLATAGAVLLLTAVAGCDRGALPGGRSGGSGGNTPAGGAGAGGGPGAAGAAPVGVGGSAVAGGAGTAGTVGTGGTGAGMACSGSETPAARRIVRLSSTQVATSIGALVDPRLTPALIDKHSLTDARHRSFPPLSNPREGAVIGDMLWSIDDDIAQTAAGHVLDNFAAITSCSDPPTADCARAFVATFAARAYRRPLIPVESDSLLRVYDETKALLADDKEAVRFSVYATLSAPQFLYRTELGTEAAVAGVLTPYEVASQLSYFLTDGPPDQPLLDAAAAGRLATATELAAQVTRIVSGEAARRNLEAAMLSNFAIANIETVVIDTARFPQWSQALSRSALRESELFFRSTLWTGVLGDLLTSRRSAIDASLAALYDVPFPPAGAPVDADGFAAVALPANRAGLITQPAVLVSRARPTATSVVGRGLLIHIAFLCGTSPAFPDPLPADIGDGHLNLTSATEQEKAAYRADPQRICASCHPAFDPYGLALESFDVIGKHRTTDDMGRPIDPSATLPAAAGGARVGGAADMARALASGSRFGACMAERLLGYALAEPVANAGADSCATRAITRAFEASDRSFTALLRAVAASRAFSERRTAP